MQHKGKGVTIGLLDNALLSAQLNEPFVAKVLGLHRFQPFLDHEPVGRKLHLYLGHIADRSFDQLTKLTQTNLILTIGFHKTANLRVSASKASVVQIKWMLCDFVLNHDHWRLTAKALDVL